MMYVSAKKIAVYPLENVDEHIAQVVRTAKAIERSFPCPTIASC
jgi:hypothetical protein